MSCTYRVDPLHSDLLVCETCREAVAALPTDLPGDAGLTKRQVALHRPDFADVLCGHDALCARRRAGRGLVSVHRLPQQKG
jgi:hypothetical protein